MSKVIINIEYIGYKHFGQKTNGWGTIFTKKFPFIHLVYAQNNRAEVDEKILDNAYPASKQKENDKK